MGIDQISAWGEAHFRKPASSEAIQSAEADLGHPLPSDLRDLLAESDGVEGEYGLGLLWPAQRIASDNVQFRTEPAFAELYMPFEGLVFFADAGNGDQFFVSLRGNNEVYIWDHESDSRTWVAATFMTYLRGWMQGDLTV